MTWSQFFDDDKTWDGFIAHLNPLSPFQLSAWARFRMDDGWSPVRFISEINSGAIQFLVKRYSKVFTVAWSSGGPCGTVTAHSLAHLSRAVQQSLNSHFTYLRISDFSPESPRVLSEYSNANWLRCRRTFGSQITLFRDLPMCASDLRASYTDNWRRNLRRGEQRNVRWEHWENPDTALMASMYLDLVDYKQDFKADWRGDNGRLTRFIEEFGDSLCIVRAISPSEETLSFRAAIRIGNLGFDILAATSLEGRKCYASHVATHGLLDVLSRTGCRRYDFGGVDKLQNLGVYNFKHGAGGLDHSYLGEWQFATPRYARNLIQNVVHFLTPQGG